MTPDENTQYLELPTPTACSLCGTDPAAGMATVTKDGETIRLCHGDVGPMTCYHLRTVYGVRELPSIEQVIVDDAHAQNVAHIKAHPYLSKAFGGLPAGMAANGMGREDFGYPSFTHVITSAPKVDPIWGRNRMFPPPSLTVTE